MCKHQLWEGKNSTVMCKHQLWEGKRSQSGQRKKKVRESSIGAGDVEEKG